MKPEDITITPGALIPYKARIMAKDKQLGIAYQDDADGLWRLEWLNVAGVLDAWVLRAIADRLDEMNKDWNEELDAAYKAIPDEENGTQKENPFA